MSAGAKEVGAGKPMGAVPAHWRLDDGALLVGGRRAIDWAAELGTPCFLYDSAALTARVAELRAAMPAGLGLHYAMKANPHGDLLAHLRPLVDGLDIASGGELTGALAAGYAAHAISFAGPGKQDEEIVAGLAAGVTFNAESVREVDRIVQFSRTFEHPARVALRINPAFETRGSGLHMGGRASPFGMDEGDVPAALALLGDGEWVGYHLYAGSQALSAEAVIATQAATVALVADLTRKTGRVPKHVNLGGGFGIPYFPGEVPLDVGEVGEALARTLKEATLRNTRFSIELGRWLVGEAGAYLVSVVEIKESRGETFLVTDGGLHHQLAASGNFGTVIRRNYPLALARAVDAPDAEREVVSVVGCLCTPLDRLGDRVLLPCAVEGDVVAVFMAGAYGATASPAAFLGHGPAVERLV